MAGLPESRAQTRMFNLQSSLTNRSSSLAFAIVAMLVASSVAAHSAGAAGSPTIIFETTSAYHHIRVIDQDGVRTLSFDGSMETRMSLQNPLRGHFEYTEYFHMPWLWNAQLTNALMIGLGGGSTQRAYEHYYTNVTIETVEIDPEVVQIARNYFHFKESPAQRVHVSDGRVFLRRSQAKYGVILLDAYVQHRYGSSIPYQLATEEFFQLASDHLTTN